jgi:hypothetical protein
MANAILASTELVYPDPVVAKPMISWERAVAELSRQPEKILGYVTASNGPFGSNVAHDVRDFVETSGGTGTPNRTRAILVGAVLAGSITTLVTNAGMSTACTLKLGVWQGNNRLCDPVLMALTGVFAPALNLLPALSIAARFSGGSIFISTDEFQRLMQGNRRASKQVVDRESKAIIDELRLANKKITEPEFTEKMTERTGASKTLIGRQWKLVPQNLKYSGRRPGT